MRQKVELLLIFLLLMLSVGGNNIKVSGAPELVLGSDGSSVELTFQLSWDNSWRDEFNWDAAWVFVKYKKEGSTAAWSHLNLGETHVVPSGFSYDCGKSAGKAVGLFIYRDGKSGGNIPNQNITLKTTLASLSGVTADDLRNKKVYVAVSAIEMVYVPYGAYYLGDAASNGSFRTLGSDGNSPYLMDSENVITLGTATGQLHAADGNSWTGSLAAAYPKGYRGFYCMKYELSQEQYVSFLNMLSYDQQKAHIGNPLDGLKKGDYIFGDRNSPSARNGIAVFAKQAGKPVLFANNLTKDDVYFAANDGQTIACNYLTPGDMLAYCDWSGLRPMSEMEYEKTCRRPYPQQVVAKEYAWNKTVASKISGASDLSGLNTDAETPTQPDRNVNVGNPALGPVRCGSFGFGSSTQTQSGGTFWGAMEMSGNVGEICYSAVTGGRAFNTTDPNTSHGTGALNTNGTATIAAGIWPVATTATNFTLRGGSFASGDTCLRVSDRTVLSVTTVRDSSRGFRAVRTFGGGSVTLDAGSIIAGNGLAIDTACLEVEYTVKNNVAAQITGMSDIPVSYIWYIDNQVVPNQSGMELKYTFQNTTTAIKSFVVTRKAVCAVGEKMATSTVTVRVSNVTFTVNPVKEITVNECYSGGSFTATPIMVGGKFTWQYNGDTLTKKISISGNNSIYSPDSVHFGAQAAIGGAFPITCEYAIAGCKSKQSLVVNAAAFKCLQTFRVCGDMLTDLRDKQQYPTVKIGNQCWMARDLNVGTYEVKNSDSWKFDEPGIQKWCQLGNGDNIDGCATYGGLYEWWEAACNGQCTSGVTTSNAQSLSFTDEADVAAKVGGVTLVNGKIQGICPVGWHIPMKTEWETLATNLGGSSVCGTKMKKPGTYNNKAWCTNGADCNSSGFNGVPGGRTNGGSGFSAQGSYSYHWMSTPEGGSTFKSSMYSGTTGSIDMYSTGYTRIYGFSVRCLKN